jgi:peptide deformylase
MDIVIYPDPVLRQPAASVTEFGAPLRERAQAMLELMYQLRGVGLAAPQVGDSLSLLVGNDSGDPSRPEQEFILINPKIKNRKGWEWGEEGCLSFPGLYAEIERNVKITVACADLEGNPQELRFEGFAARIVQHEMDHLEGKLFIDRLTPADRIRVRRRLEELEARQA